MHTTVQFVCFETTLALPLFLSRWEAFAASFLARGIDRIVLSESEAEFPSHSARSSAARFRFISRNAWPRDRFAAVFPAGLPPDAGGGGIVAVQAGGFRVVEHPGVNLLEARRDLSKLIVLVPPSGAPSGEVVRALQAVVAEEAPLDARHAVYERAVRGGRFEAALEVYASPDDAPGVRDRITASLAAAPSLAGSLVTVQKEAVALPQ